MNGSERVHRPYLYRALFRAVGCVVAVALINMVWGFATFESISDAPASDPLGVSLAVVFTGAFERVDKGLELLNRGEVPRLYVSGVNAVSGISPARFVEQFAARNPDLADLRRLVECCLEWGERAETTLQNALDTKCWLERRRLIGPVLLITSRRHMARAFAALSGAIPGRKILPYPVKDGIPPSDLRAKMKEYFKYLGTLVVFRAPRWISTALLGDAFMESCTEKL